MKIITQLVILTLSLLLVNADQYCDDAIKQYQAFGNRCSLKNLTFSNCCDLRIVSKVSGVHKQSTKAFGTNDVYCDMTTKDGGWTVIQRNNKDSLVNFNRNWTDYEKGFGDLNTEFWYGLEEIHCLTQRGRWEMRVDYQKNDKSWSYLHYGYFSLGTGSSEYPISLGSFTGIGSDWFSSINGHRFTTPDNDNDRNYYGNCAASDKSGWWYYNCRSINLNKQPPYVNGDVLFSEMKIRPKDCITQ